jgi:hypothetical protein
MAQVGIGTEKIRNNVTYACSVLEIRNILLASYGHGWGVTPGVGVLKDASGNLYFDLPLKTEKIYSALYKIYLTEDPKGVKVVLEKRHILRQIGTFPRMTPEPTWNAPVRVEINSDGTCEKLFFDVLDDKVSGKFGARKL